MKTLNKKIALAAVVAGVAGIVGVKPANAITSWGPERDTFTWQEPSTYRTFNSITDNPSIGDERNFVRVREYGTDNKFGDDVTVEVGKTYEVYVYFHNNASANLNNTGVGIAENVRLAMEMPTEINAGEAAVIKGTISATNTTPASVWDTAYLSANDTVYLRYVQGTAAIHNSGTANGKLLDDASLWSSGAKVAYADEYWGIVPGCNEYAGYVTFQIKVDQPKFYIEKEVSIDGGKTWSESVKVNPGATLKFRIKYSNIGTTAQKSVTAYDTLDSSMEYVPNSTQVKIPANADFVSVADKLFKAGLVIGDFAAGQEATITYDVKLKDDMETFGCGNTVVYNNAYVATANGTMYDKARIAVERPCELPSEIPDTGPAEIILAAVIVLGVGAGGVYWFQSKKTLKEVRNSIAGKGKM